MTITLDEFKKIEHYLNVNEDGMFNAQGVLVEDDEAGQELFDNLTTLENSSRFCTDMDGTKAIVEFYNSIYVVQSLTKLEGDLWSITMPYKYKDQFKTEDLTLDEWDRFHGFSVRGIPFVFSHRAQAQFFDLLDEFDDDTITVNGKVHAPKLWPNCETSEDGPNSKMWTERYLSNDTPWDFGEHHPCLNDILPQIKLTRARILVLGCGRAHDAAFLAEQGHIVTAIDASEAAIESAKELYGNQRNLTLIKADALNLSEEFHGQYDVVFEHTLYCAIHPSERNQLVKSWLKALTPEGHLLGVFFAMETPAGPPYGGSEWEIKSRLDNHYQFLYWTRWKKSPGKRRGMEVVVYAQRKPFN